MNDVIAVLTTALLALALFAFTPVGWLAFVLQMGATGTAVGSVLALYRVRRRPGYPVTQLILRWTVVGLGAGLAAQLVDAVA